MASPHGSDNGENNGEKKLSPRKDSNHSDISRSEIENPMSRGETIDTLEADKQAPRYPELDEEERKRLEASAKLENPLRGLSAAELARRGEDFCARHGLTAEDDVRAFRLGAVIAGNLNQYDAVAMPEGLRLTDREREVLDREVTHKWSQPTMLYAVIVICSLCAAVQGMDETVVNGAQGFYKTQFGIGDPNSKRGMYCCCYMYIIINSRYEYKSGWRNNPHPTLTPFRSTWHALHLVYCFLHVL